MNFLYDYQRLAVDEILDAFRKGKRTPLLYAPTGSGKTVIACQLIGHFNWNKKRSIFVVDRKKLVTQAAKHLRYLGLKVGIMQAGNSDYSDSDDVIVCTIQTLANRKFHGKVDLVIIDEAHILHKSHKKLIKEWNAVKFLGLSATPIRPGLGNYFDKLIKTASIKELTQKHYLVPVEPFSPSVSDILSVLKNVKITAGDYQINQLAKAMNNKVLIGDIVLEWQKLGKNRQTLCFCVSIEHSMEVAKQFRDEGIPALHLDGNASDEERAVAFEQFENKTVRILCSVNLIGIGVDLPIASCAIIARPTMSLALHIQFIGRVLRTFPGKENAILIDHACNIVRHGLPEDFTVEQLDKSDDAKKHKPVEKKEKPDYYPCHRCEYLIPRDERKCPYCGAEKPPRVSRIIWDHGSLVPLSNVDHAKKHGWTIGTARDFWLELRGYANLKGKSTGWAYYRFRDATGKAPLPEWKDLNNLAPSYATLRWVENENRKYWFQKKLKERAE